MPKLTISIASFNTRNYLEECLRSIGENTAGLEYEVVVVDNASGDGSAQMVKELFPQVRLIENQTNRGFSGAHNQAIAASSSEYFLVLNSDVHVLPDAFGALVRFMDAHLEATAASSVLLNSDRSLQENLGPFPSLASELSYRIPFVAPLLKRRYDYTRAGEIDDFADPCAIIRRTVIEQVGGYDEQFFLYMEETDWHYRMRRAGGRFYLVPESKVIHYGGRSIPDDANKKYLLYQKNLYRFFRKHYGAHRLRLLKIIVLVSCLQTLLSVAIAGLWKAKEASPQRLDLVRRLLRMSLWRQEA